jgi:hypothetical protein
MSVIRKTFALSGITALIAAASIAGGSAGYASPAGEPGGGNQSGNQGGPGGTAGTTCNVPSRYATIQTAVDAPTCKIIRVAAGTYAENVVINRSLTLYGARSGQDARTRRSGGESVIGGNAANITISAGNVIVDGFTLNGPVDRGTAAILLQSGNTGETIQNNIINNPGRAAQIQTSRTTFRGNLVKNTATARDAFEANTVAVRDVAFFSNSFSGGVSANDNYRADITIIEGNANVTVADNRSTGDGTLIALFQTAGAKIYNNTVAGASDSSAIYLGGKNSNVVVTGNVVSGASSGVKVNNISGYGTNSGVNIYGNVLRNNAYGVNVDAASTSTAVQVTRNYLVGNTTAGVFTDPAAGATTNATCNWWGSSRGPGAVGPGNGDKVSSTVTYQPWLRSSNLNGDCRR